MRRAKAAPGQSVSLVPPGFARVLSKRATIVSPLIQSRSLEVTVAVSGMLLANASPTACISRKRWLGVET